MWIRQSPQYKELTFMLAIGIRIAIALTVTVVAATPTLAQNYAIAWHTIDGGGVMSSTGGQYESSGTVGQHDAGEMTGGTYSLTGGFWFAQVPGDCDGDGDVDVDDFVELEACLLGPGGGLGAGCGCFDFDDSSDVDLFDFAEFQVAFTG
ncbi:MAG: hypothetical protein JSV19_05170 [Phycisphaerales bacterium]|nr:MAG: hypothetical protein JSV19_05170 [Phycisphaerales bacterium]